MIAEVVLKSGKTTNGSKSPVKFLGKIICIDRMSTNASASNIISKFQSVLRNLSKRPIRGEYKLWIYRHHIAPSFNFQWSINALSKSTLTKLESVSTKCLKKWLNLPRNATRAILYHPEVLNCPQVTFQYEKASLSFLVAIYGFIRQFNQGNQISYRIKQYDRYISTDNIEVLKSIKSSASSIPSIKNNCKKFMKKKQTDHWDNHLDSLTVQGKFSSITVLESEQMYGPN